MRKSVSRRGWVLGAVVSGVFWAGLSPAGIAFETGTLQGTVLTNGGVAVPASVRAIASDGSFQETSCDPATGAYAMTLPTGSYRVEARYEQMNVGASTATITTTTPAVDDFRFAAGTVTLHVTRDGANDANAAVTLTEAAPTDGCGTAACSTDPMKPDFCQCTAGGRSYYCDPTGCRWMDNPRPTRRATVRRRARPSSSPTISAESSAP